MNDGTIFTVAKDTGTYADTLKAIELATILQELIPEDAHVTVGDAGTNFVIRLPSPLTDKPSGVRLTVGYQYLSHEKAKPAPAGVKPDPFLYKHHKELKKVWQQWSKFTAGRPL